MDEGEYSSLLNLWRYALSEQDFSTSLRDDRGTGLCEGTFDKKIEIEMWNYDRFFFRVDKDQDVRIGCMLYEKMNMLEFENR